MNIGGETIQLSFGPASNAVTSHLCNLQGLACTSSDDPYANSDTPTPLCDPYITHAVQNETYVPRVLFVDGKNCFNPWPSRTSSASMASNSSGLPQSHENHHVAGSAWKGNVEVHHRSSYQNTNHSSGNSNDHFNDNHIYVDKSINANWSQLEPSQLDAFSQFQNVASVLSSSASTHSRYHSSRYSHVSSQFVHSTGSALQSDDGRVMKWDDDEEEEEEEEEFMRERRARMERQRWAEEENNIQNQLHNAWDSFLGIDSDPKIEKKQNDVNHQGETSGQESNSKENSHEDVQPQISTKAKMRKNALDSLQWMNYFMPPHPKNGMYSAALPFDRESNIGSVALGQEQSMLYSYHCGQHPNNSSSFCTANGMNEVMTNDWRINILSEKIRKIIEACDCVRGFQVAVDGDMSFFAGLGTSVLEELGDECRSAGKITTMISGADLFICSDNDDNGNGNREEDSRYWRSENKAVKAFRSHLNNGLALHGICENSDLVVPLSLSKCWESLHKEEMSRNLFEASAAGALALETATLPYRLAKSGCSTKRSKIGIGSGYYHGSSQADDDAYPTADKLSYHEFISSLKPSNRHIITEMSSLSHPLSPGQVHQSLLQGTSIERRQLEEERNRNRNSRYRRSRGRDIDPGLWMEDEGPNGGIVTSLSPIVGKESSRSLHHHFALASSLRPLPSSVGDVVPTYTTALMEGMAIRYRPQCSVATVVNQSFQDITGSCAYSAGSYWSSIMGPKAKMTQTLSVLGNTTRIYPHLKTTSTNFKNALSRKYAGYLSRDGMSGLAPEEEDCTDAMEACMSLRDIYEPPSFGFDSDDEGVYFDDNTE